jgi:tyrosyl-tRNA synthetase
MQYLDFNPALKNAAEMVNNYDWFKNFTFLDFIRDVGKHITVNYMMAKDSVKKRIEGETGMSFTEFTYQLVQGYDFYWLYKNKSCKLQMGGSDQWGNIVTGTELIRRKAGGEAFAFTCPLITKADGGKFGKTESGNVWLDANRTSPYQFYQFWLNASDTDAEKWIKIFTFLTKDAIDMLIHEHKMNPSERVLQKTLAQEITVFVHGIEEYEKAIETTQKLFANQTAPAESLSIEDLEGMEGIVKIDFAKDKIAEGIDVVSFLAETTIFPSKGEARKTVQGGGVSINRKKVEGIDFKIETSLLLHSQYLLVQKGKKNYYLVKVA